MKVFCRTCEEQVEVDAHAPVLGEYICPKGHTTSWLVEWDEYDEEPGAQR